MQSKKPSHNEGFLTTIKMKSLKTSSFSFLLRLTELPCSSLEARQVYGEASLLLKVSSMFSSFKRRSLYLSLSNLDLFY